MTTWSIAREWYEDGGTIAEQIYASRDIPNTTFEDFVNMEYDGGLADPFLLADMDTAVVRITEARKNNEEVVIYGDYDIDGTTAATLLKKIFDLLSIKSRIYIPDRFEEGYGLNSESLKKIAESGVKLVISVDCGITSIREVRDAKKHGLSIIITDHHAINGVIPTDAVAVINPKRTDSKYPFRELAGVGVAFALARALCTKFPKDIPAGREKWLLDLVALGTVCDVVPLTGENRLMTRYGLLVMAKTRNIGLRELINISNTEISSISSDDLGFRLGPRLNAAGRIEHANIAIKLLNSSDKKDAMIQADKLNKLNIQRREQTDKIVTEATKMAKEYQSDPLLVLDDKAWSHGIVGIAAARLSEKFGKPTIILQIDGKYAKGSARSVGDFSIIDALHNASDLLERYGGHAYAAGMTIDANKVEQLRQTLNDYVKKQSFTYSPILKIDLKIPAQLINLDSYEQLEQLSPFGRDNAQPILASSMVLQSVRPIGNESRHLKFSFRGSNGDIAGVAFSAQDKWPDIYDLVGKSIEIAFKLMKNTWNNRTTAEIEVIDVRDIK